MSVKMRESGVFMRMRMMAGGMAGAALLLCPLAGALERPAAQKPQVEVVFVLDTTGSMGGLIEGAKRKIWSIANEIAKGKPVPQIKMGLVAYRDKGDEYVTRVFDLSANLDQTYKDLLSLRAGGGGDGPEHVLKGLEEAIDKFSWSKDPKAFKVVYLVGDAPPHEDYGDTPGLEALLQKAMRRGLIVNSVQCGSDPQTTAAWQKAARLGEGKFLAIPQDGGMVAVATPFDERMAEISRRLESTMIAYGRHRKEARKAFELGREVVAMAAAPAAAERAVFMSAAGTGLSAEMDLGRAVEEKRVNLSALKEEELPDEMRRLSPQERQRKLDSVLKERKGLKAEFDSLALRRAGYLAREAKKSGKADSFDAKLIEALKDQASRKGIIY